jgi:hypothetical protein
MKRRRRLSPSQRRANAQRAAVKAARRVERLMRDLREQGLDLRGDPPILSDGHATPPEVLAARFPVLAARLSELKGHP